LVLNAPLGATATATVAAATANHDLCSAANNNYNNRWPFVVALFAFGATIEFILCATLHV